MEPVQRHRCLRCCCLYPLLPYTRTLVLDRCNRVLSFVFRWRSVRFQCRTAAKCMWLVRAHAKLSALLYGVVNASVLRRHCVPADSVELSHCHEAVETSDLPGTLMWMIGSRTTISQTSLDDLLKLSYNVAAVSDRSGDQ